jgi:hypothetical protein
MAVGCSLSSIPFVVVSVGLGERERSAGVRGDMRAARPASEARWSHVAGCWGRPSDVSGMCARAHWRTYGKHTSGNARTYANGMKTAKSKKYTSGDARTHVRERDENGQVQKVH